MFTVTGGVPWGEIQEWHHKASPALNAVLMIYVSLMLFFMYPIVYGMYTARVFEIKESDAHALIARRKGEAHMFTNELKSIFNDAGYEGDYQLSEEDLAAVMAIPEV